MTQWVCIECKERKLIPKWLAEAVAQIVTRTPAEKLPIVVLHKKGGQHKDDVVMLRLEDFQNWFGGIDNG